MKNFKKRLWIGLPLLILMLCILGGTLFLVLSQPAQSQVQETQRFVIPRGQAVSVIAGRLQQQGLIKNSLVFRLIVRKENLANRIQAGSFDLSPSMSSTEIAHQLTQGTFDVWITIPEGWRREEIAQSLAKQELEDFSPEEFLTLTTGKEGYLFPDTYLVPRQMSTEQIVQLLEQTFERKVVTGLAEEISTSSHPLDQAIIMASIVEREAKGVEQMQTVAGILWNRVKLGMALQADATVQYAKGFNKTENTWWATPLVGDRRVNSVYNTYRHAGLPPQPIANPGLEAIKAALNPTQTNYLYYLHDAQGKIHYAETLEGHNANVEQYLRN